MKTSYLTNLVLLIVLGLLYWLNIQAPTDEKTTTTLSQTKPNSIDKIIISQSNRQDIVLVKQTDIWQLSQPIQARANPMRVKLLLSLLTSHTDRQQAISDQKNLEQFGFINTSTRLQLGDQTFIFGNIESISQQRYVLHNQIVYLADDTISPMLNTNASSFIDNRLIPNHNIVALTLPYYKHQNIISETLQLNLSNGHWISQPEHPSDKLINLVDAWKHAYALQVIPLEAIASKFDNQTGHRVTLSLEGIAEPLQFTLYLHDNALFIVHSKLGLAYQFPRALYQQLILNSDNNA